MATTNPLIVLALYQLRKQQQEAEEDEDVAMDDFASDTDSDYTSYWRDWVSLIPFFCVFFWWFEAFLLGGILLEEI